MGDHLSSNPARSAKMEIEQKDQIAAGTSIRSSLRATLVTQRESNQRKTQPIECMLTKKNEQLVDIRESCPGCGPAPKSVRR